MFTKMFTELFIPWYRGIKYNGLIVEGEWEANHEYEKTMEYSSLSLKQLADKITGRWTIIEEDKQSKKKGIKTFTTNGVIKDRFIILTVQNTDKKQIGLGSMLIEANGNGYELEGCETWYSVDNKKIKSADILFTRKERI
jgi:hypothetical protein